MLFSRSFLLGLLAYLRQAALSLHRAPASFSASMRDYYGARGLPSPARVIARVDTTMEAGKPRGHEFTARLLGTSIALDEDDLLAVRESLRALERMLEMQVVESDAERIRIRLALLGAEELVRRKLGIHAREADKIEHLNETPGLGTQALSELAGAGWPESS